MKKIISVLILALMLMTMITVYATADDQIVAEYTYCIDGTEYTVDFSESAIPAEKQEMIAHKLLGIPEEDLSESYGLRCTLFGHSLVSSSVSKITHKVYTYSPRCKKDKYFVDYCEHCDYITESFVGTSYIICCAED